MNKLFKPVLLASVVLLAAACGGNNNHYAQTCWENGKRSYGTQHRNP